MESNDELKEIDIKNCTCYYFNDMIKIKDFDFENQTKIFWFIYFDWCKTIVY